MPTEIIELKENNKKGCRWIVISLLQKINDVGFLAKGSFSFSNEGNKKNITQDNTQGDDFLYLFFLQEGNSIEKHKCKAEIFQISTWHFFVLLNKETILYNPYKQIYYSLKKDSLEKGELKESRLSPEEETTAISF